MDRARSARPDQRARRRGHRITTGLDQLVVKATGAPNKHMCIADIVKNYLPTYSKAQQRSEAVVDGVDKGTGQLAHALRQPRPINELEPNGHRDRVLRQARRRGVEQHIAGEAPSIEVRGEGHDMGLPDLNFENFVGGDNDTRSTLVEIDPVHRTTCYHGADRSIRSPAARASCSVGRLVAASTASARSCSAKEVVDWAAWRRS